MLKYIAIIGICIFDERETGLFCLDMQRMMLKMSPDNNKLTSLLEKISTSFILSFSSLWAQRCTQKEPRTCSQCLKIESSKRRILFHIVRTQHSLWFRKDSNAILAGCLWRFRFCTSLRYVECMMLWMGYWLLWENFWNVPFFAAVSCGILIFMPLNHLIFFHRIIFFSLGTFWVPLLKFWFQ